MTVSQAFDTFPQAPHLLQAILRVGHSAAGIMARTEREVKVSLHQGQIVASAQLCLEEEGGAYTAQLPVGDNGYAVTQNVRFIHVVGREDDGPA